jgi:hypothetical protein
VTAWEPPRRFAFRTGGQQDQQGFMAFEWLVEGRGDGTTVLRLVQSGVLGDDWEAEYDALARAGTCTSTSSASTSATSAAGRPRRSRSWPRALRTPTGCGPGCGGGSG